MFNMRPATMKSQRMPDANKTCPTVPAKNMEPFLYEDASMDRMVDVG